MWLNTIAAFRPFRTNRLQISGFPSRSLKAIGYWEHHVATRIVGESGSATLDLFVERASH